MKVSCADCSSFSLQKAGPEMAWLGFGRCEIRSICPGHTFAALYRRECKDFKPAPPDVAARRRAFIDREPKGS